MAIQNRQKPCCDCAVHTVPKSKTKFCVVCGSKETKFHFHYIEGDYIGPDGKLVDKSEVK